MPICFRLLTHWARRAASRAACTAGSSSATSTPMMAITTSSSISVKPAGEPMGRELCDHHASRSWDTLLALSHHLSAGTRQGVHGRKDYFFAASLLEASAGDGDIGTTTALRRWMRTSAVSPT